MSACGFNTIINSATNASKNMNSPQIGQGMYIGIKYPGTNTSVASNVNTMMPGLGAEIVIQTDANAISSLSAQPQNVMRFTGQGGVGYIQADNIRFSLPYSGAAGVAILPSTGAVNLTSMNFLSSINSSSGNVNWNQLASTVKGYGWATVN